jgi:hypothetical protein
MLDFLKIFGYGVLYVILLPLIILFFALYAVYCIFVFLVMLVKAIVAFFRGRSLFDPMAEDKIAKERLANLIFNPALGTYQSNQKESRVTEDEKQPEEKPQSKEKEGEIIDNDSSAPTSKPSDVYIETSNDVTSENKDGEIEDKTGDDIL